MDEPTDEPDGPTSGWPLPPQRLSWACPSCKWPNPGDANRCSRCDGPRRRLRWMLATAVLVVAVALWFVLGVLLLFAMMMVLGFESGNHPEHSAEFTRTAGIWVVGLVVGIVLLIALNRRDRAVVGSSGNRRGLWVFLFMVAGLPALFSLLVLVVSPGPALLPWLVTTWSVMVISGYRIWRIDHP